MKFRRRALFGYAVMWLVVIVVVLWADSSAEEHRAKQKITSFEIVLSGGGDHIFVDRELIEVWLEEQDLHPAGRVMADVDLARVEEALMSHSAISGANAYMTYSGDMVLNIALRSVVGRLRLEGYDMYIASDGSLLPPDAGYLLSVPVVTGSYKPLFDGDYEGDHVHSADGYLSVIEGHFLDIDSRKEALLKRREESDAQLRNIEKQGVKRTMFMSAYEYRGRVASLKERKSEARKRHAERDRAIELEIRALEAERLQVSLEEQRIRNMVDDFARVVAFVAMVDGDDFWRAEVVQIELSGGGDSPMQVAIVPRSGGFIVDLGTTDNLEGKLAQLREFYDKTLSNIGWDKYKHISLRYNGQVVCK